MLDIEMIICVHGDCSKMPSYGVADSKTAEYCTQHALDGMTNVVEKRICIHGGCSKIPSLGEAGSKKAEYCAQHALTGMVNVVSKRCVHGGCIKKPSYGIDGSRTAEYCAQHAPERMVNVVRQVCVHEGCSKQPSYGVTGSKKAEYCAQHALAEMAIIIRKRCVQGDSSKHPPVVVGISTAVYYAGDDSNGVVSASNECIRKVRSNQPSLVVPGSTSVDYHNSYGTNRTHGVAATSHEPGNIDFVSPNGKWCENFASVDEKRFMVSLCPTCIKREVVDPSSGSSDLGSSKNFQKRPPKPNTPSATAIAVEQESTATKGTMTYGGGSSIPLDPSVKTELTIYL